MASARYKPFSMIEWAVSPGLTPYPEALAFMEARVQAIIEGQQAEMVWLLEHPPLYTAGTSAREHDLLDRGRFPVFKAGRGGSLTYHGPGQRIAYVMLDLNHRGRDIRSFITGLETWIIETLAVFGVSGKSHRERPGVWVSSSPLSHTPSSCGRGAGEDKIAALGVRVRRWVSFHGIALNIAPDLNDFSGIVPCGYRQYGVSSLYALGKNVAMHDVDLTLRQVFEKNFGHTQEVRAPVVNKE